MTPRTATLIGLTAILMWSLLSVLTVATGKIPAFQLAAMTFAIGAAVAFASWIWRPAAFGALRQPLTAWVVGVGGLFGYHALYFLALRFAPPAEAGLLNYLWPLLIVLFSSLLPGERLAPHHIIGALLGLAGTVLLFAGNSGGFAPGQIPGLAAAFVAAFVWAAYSVMSRKLKGGADRCGGRLLPGDRVARSHSSTAWSRPRSGRIHRRSGLPSQRLASVRSAPRSFTWDIGMKRGDIRVLGAASYATPLLSTAFLILAGFARPTATIAIAAILIAGGGLIAAKGYGLEAGLSDGLPTRLSAATNPALRVRTWQNRNRARPCIRPASSRRCSRRIARYAAVQSPAVARRLRDQRQA